MGLLPLATSAQQVEIYDPWAWISSKGKTADSRYAFGVAHDFKVLWKQQVLFTSSGHKIFNGSYVQDVLEAIFLSATSAMIKVPGYSKPDSLEAKGNHIADISTKNAALKGLKYQTSVTSKVTNDNLKKLVWEAQELAPEKEIQDWKSSNCWLNKRENSDLGQITIQSS